ncbi:phasin family protein [Pseudomonas abieticivorans]|uniref:phasin family protein n=1 Tax=Pseudomonas abieticivorans TaxID=2931382 RepID=UPI0020BECA2F|nr:phasin family protein [Pseudomonas sp. PIA16]
MAKVTLKKKVEVPAEQAIGEVRSYARKIWLAGLGAYAKAGKESVSYIKDLIKTGETVEKDGKKLINKELKAANTQIDEAKSDIKTELTSVKGKVELQLDKIESAFDTRVASALNRIGIPSKHDVETLSAKLDELTALLERVARKQ